MTCKTYVKTVIHQRKGKLHREITVLTPDPSVWRSCWMRLEELISFVVTARGRRSWLLNGLLHGRLQRQYSILKRALLYGSKWSRSEYVLE